MGIAYDRRVRTGPGYRNSNPSATGIDVGIQVAHAKYDFAVDGGAIATIVPQLNATIPDNAVIVGATINVPIAPLSAGAATVSVGLSAGAGGVAALLAATAKATLSIDSLHIGVPTRAAPIKLTAAAQITIVPAAFVLTAGVIEVWVEYFVATQ